MNAGVAIPPPLRGPFATPAPDQLCPSPATIGLVRSQVQALLDSTDAYHGMPLQDRERIAGRLTHIASYAAECAREVWGQSEKLGQRPVLKEREVRQGPLAQAAAASRPRSSSRSNAPAERPGAVNQVARITQETIRAIAFPVFVADLIKGTFNAIIQANIKQMEQFGHLLENVSKTVDQFMTDNISDAQARDWLQERYPDHIRVREGVAVPADGADERPAPDWRGGLNLTDNVSLDESSIEDKLVPAARRRLAESRLQMLSTMVLMGVNRIVVTGGKIRATMGFHIDATDKSHQEHATDTDFRAAAAGSFGFGPWSASLSTSFSYVSSSRQSSDSEIHVDTDLTGEVEIHFKSDYFPVERFASTGTIGQIQQNTPVPSANPLGDTPAAGGTVGAYESPRARPRPNVAPTLPPIGTPLPEARTPVAPTAPHVERHVDAPEGSRWHEPAPGGAGGGDSHPPESPAPAPAITTPQPAPTPAPAPATPPADDNTGPPNPGGGTTPPAPAPPSGGNQPAGSGAKKQAGSNPPAAAHPPAAAPNLTSGAAESVEPSLDQPRQSYWQGAFA